MVQLKPLLNVLKAAFALFQFHNGTIKTMPLVICLYIVSDFNSIMVQLKQVSLAFSVTPCVIFQFHNGTIKTLSDDSGDLIISSISIP